MGTILQALMGWDATFSMIFVTAIVIIYTLMGGMWSVSLTDFVQFFIITIGIIFIMLPFSVGAAGGLENIAATVPAEYWDVTNIGWTTIVQFFFLYCLGIIVGQDIWQRFLTAKSVKVARRGGIASGIYIMIYGVICALIGMAAFVVLPNLDSTSLAFATLADTTVPTGFLGIVLTAVLAVLMSTASADLIASTTLLGNDIIKYLRERKEDKSYEEKTLEEVKATDRRDMRRNRITMIFMGLFAMLVAVALQDVLVALDVSYAVLSGALFFPIIFALFWKRATPKAAIISIIGSAIVVCIGLFTISLTAIEPIAWGLVTGAILMIVVTLIDTRGGRQAKGFPKHSLEMFDYSEDEDGTEKIFEKLEKAEEVLGPEKTK